MVISMINLRVVQGLMKMNMGSKDYIWKFHYSMVTREEVLDWLIDVEQFFKLMEILEKQKVKLVSVRLKAGAFLWWEQTQSARARQQ